MSSIEQYPALVLLSRLLDIPSPSGHEAEMATFLHDYLQQLGYAPESDAAGNVLLHLEGRETTGPLTCYASHMDEIGIIVNRINEDGTLTINRSGGLHAWKLGEVPIELLGDNESIVCMTSMGSTHGVSHDSAIQWSQVRLLTGLTPEQLADAGVRPGTLGVPIRAHRGPYLFGDEADPLVAAWTFDDRMGIVIQLMILQQLKERNLTPINPTLIAFTVSEEIGGHGAKAVALHQNPYYFIAVDGSPTPPEAPLTLDGRPGVWMRDRLANYDVALAHQFMESARAVGTELQPATYTGAASDASLVAYAGNTARIGCIGHVRENSHGYEVLRASVIENSINTLRHFMTGE